MEADLGGSESVLLHPCAARSGFVPLPGGMDFFLFRHVSLQHGDKRARVEITHRWYYSGADGTRRSVCGFSAFAWRQPQESKGNP
jgi:hypothetical protein